MYAIVEICGQQFCVENNQQVFVHQIDVDAGEILELNRVLLLENDGDIRVGTPTLDSVKITAVVLGHLRGDKVIIFKKKRRKSYKLLRGHRQYLTEIYIKDIVIDGKTTNENLDNVFLDSLIAKPDDDLEFDDIQDDLDFEKVEKDTDNITSEEIEESENK